MSGWRKRPPVNVEKAPPSKAWVFLRRALSKITLRGGSKGAPGPLAKAPRLSAWGYLRRALNPVTIIALLAAVLFLELNFQYYDYKGKMPFSPGRLIYQDILPDVVTGVLRGAGKLWGGFVHGRTAVTLLPDHVMLCVEKTMAWEDVAPGSPEALYKAHVEDVVRSVAQRHAQPGVTFDEDRFHYDGGGWIAYTDVTAVEIYRTGNRLVTPVALAEYWSVGSNLICGNTNGREEGPEHYRAYAYTFEGKAVPARE